MEQFWLIYVSGYGSFGFFGTEKDAEEMRLHKSRWEGGTGTKTPIVATHAEAKRCIDWTRFAASRGYPQESELLPRIDAYLALTGATP